MEGKHEKYWQEQCLKLIREIYKHLGGVDYGWIEINNDQIVMSIVSIGLPELIASSGLLILLTKKRDDNDFDDLSITMGNIHKENQAFKISSDHSWYKLSFLLQDLLNDIESGNV